MVLSSTEFRNLPKLCRAAARPIVLLRTYVLCFLFLRRSAMRMKTELLALVERRSRNDGLWKVVLLVISPTSIQGPYFSLEGGGKWSDGISALENRFDAVKVHIGRRARGGMTGAGFSRNKRLFARSFAV